MKILITALLTLALTDYAPADTIEKFSGRATKAGKLVYNEAHVTTINDAGDVVEANTTYTDPSGKKIAEIHSDFRHSLTAPAHEFLDLRFNKHYGVRYVGDQAIMFTKNPNGIESTKKVTSKPKQTLLVGCQGLGYYFRANLAELKAAKNLPILFLVPGDLDTFNFQSSYKGKDALGFEIFEIEIKNWLLRAFAPKLTLTYDGQKNRLVKYEGLSNLYDDKQKQQNVVIDYSWNE